MVPDSVPGPFARFARRLSACTSVLLALGVFIVGAQSEAAGLLQPHWGALVRLALFGGFALILHLGLQRRWLGSLISAALLGAADEIHQVWLPGRNASLADWTVDIFGAAVCLVLVSLVAKRRSREP